MFRRAWAFYAKFHRLLLLGIEEADYHCSISPKSKHDLPVTIRREFTQSAAGVFIALFAILLDATDPPAGEAAEGSIAPEAVVALLGFSALNYIPTLLSLSTFIAILPALPQLSRFGNGRVVFLRRFADRLGAAGDGVHPSPGRGDRRPVLLRFALGIVEKRRVPG